MCEKQFVQILSYVVHKVEDGEFGTAAWQYILELHRSDSHRKYKLAPKLTKKAVELPAFSKIKVSRPTAARVLSHNVSAAIETLVACDIMDSQALATVEFCQKMNDLFDIFNSYCVKGPVHLRNAIKCTSDHVMNASELKEWITSWQFIDCNKKDCTKIIKCISGLEMNIVALELLTDEFIMPGSERYLLMRKVNQDRLKHYFSIARHRGGFCTDPSPRQFISAFNNANLSKLFNCSNKDSNNCEVVDWSRVILDMKSAQKLKILLLFCVESPQLCRPIELPKNYIDLAELNSNEICIWVCVRKDDLSS